MPRAILDSSPIAPPPAARHPAQTQKRPLKRTASTASLLTPPQTVRRRGKVVTRGSQHRSDSEGDGDSEEEEERIEGSLRTRFVGVSRKRRRTDKLDAVVGELSGMDEENPFWTASTSAKKAGKPHATGRGKVTLDDDEDEDEDQSPPSSPVPMIHHRHAKSLVSPPPSCRKKQPAFLNPPTTPKKNRRTRAGGPSDELPVRDSPNNPFLADDSPSSGPAVPESPRTPLDTSEKPTINYVFRGQKRVYANPLYNLSPSAIARSRLPIDHPEFEVDETCPPRLLFPDAQKKHITRSTTRESREKQKGKAPEPASWDDSDDDEAMDRGLHSPTAKTLRALF